MSFKPWLRALRGYLEIKHLRYLLDFRLEQADYLNAPDQPSSVFLQNRNLTDKFFPNELPADWIDIVPRIPNSLMTEIQLSHFPVHVFHKRNRNIPPELKLLVSRCALVIALGRKLYPVYNDEDSFCTGETDLMQAAAIVKAVIRASVSEEHLHLFENHEHVYDGFMAIKQMFARDNKLERTNITARMNQITFRSLSSYLNLFQRLTAEYENAGGNRDDEIVLAQFLSNIPNSKYEIHKTRIYQDPCSTLDQTILYFKKLADVEETLKRQVSSHSMHSKQQTSGKISINQVNTSTHSKPTKCKKCGGWGHIPPQCPTKAFVCHSCGQPGHMKRDCPTTKQVSISRLLSMVCSDSEDDDNLQEEDTQQVELSLSPPVSPVEGSDDIGIINMIRAVSLNSEYNNAICNSRFKQDYVCLLLDSGANRHITGKLDLLKNIETVSPPIQVTSAFGTTTMATRQGTLRILTEHHTILEFRRVLFCETIQGTIISVPELANSDLSVEFSGDTATLKKGHHSIYVSTRQHGGFYVHGTSKFSAQQGVKVNKVTVKDLLHFRFGHAHHSYIRNAGFHPNQVCFCHPCGQTKLPQAKKTNKVNPLLTSTFVPKKTIHKLHMDTVGPFVKDIHGNRFLLVIVDNFSNYLWAYPVKSKANIPKTIVRFVQQV